MFATEEGSWKCDVCMVLNKKTSTSCEACETKRPGYAEKAKIETSASTTEGGGSSIGASGFTFGMSSLASATSSSIGSSGFSFGIGKEVSGTNEEGGFKFGASASGSTTGGSRGGTGFVFSSSKGNPANVADTTAVTTATLPEEDKINDKDSEVKGKDQTIRERTSESPTVYPSTLSKAASSFVEERKTPGSVSIGSAPKNSDPFDKARPLSSLQKFATDAVLAVGMSSLQKSSKTSESDSSSLCKKSSLLSRIDISKVNVSMVPAQDVSLIPVIAEEEESSLAVSNSSKVKTQVVRPPFEGKGRRARARRARERRLNGLSDNGSEVLSSLDPEEAYDSEDESSVSSTECALSSVAVDEVNCDFVNSEHFDQGDDSSNLRRRTPRPPAAPFEGKGRRARARRARERRERELQLLQTGDHNLIQYSAGDTSENSILSSSHSDSVGHSNQTKPSLSSVKARSSSPSKLDSINHHQDGPDGKSEHGKTTLSSMAARLYSSARTGQLTSLQMGKCDKEKVTLSSLEARSSGMSMSESTKHHQDGPA
eukprot:11405319-Ditylum_brightwellii.AAC.1